MGYFLASLGIASSVIWDRGSFTGPGDGRRRRGDHHLFLTVTQTPVVPGRATETDKSLGLWEPQGGLNTQTGVFREGFLGEGGHC